MREQIIIKREKSFSDLLFVAIKKLPNFKLLLLLTLSLLLVFADIRKTFPLNFLRESLRNMVYSQKFLYNFSPVTQNSNNNNYNVNRDLTASEILRSASLTNLLLEHYREENQKLKTLLNFINNNHIKKHGDLYTAQALMDFNNHIITFPNYENSKNGQSGASFSIKPGQLIINEFGIIGKVALVEKKIITGTLLTNPQFRVQAISGKSNYQFIVAGTGKRNLLKALYLPEGASLEEGELILSAGNSNNNVSMVGENLIIGKVKSLRTEGPFVNLLKKGGRPNSTEIYEIEPAFIEGKLNFISVLALRKTD